jgi:hypothetical protein
MAQFEDLSNDVILCIWDQLSSADVIYSFSDLNNRINSLLSEFHGLYKELNIGYCSLSACRFLCRQVPSMIEWRLGLTTLKIGNVYRCCQMDMLASEVRKFIIKNHFSRQGKSSDNISKDSFRLIMAYNKNIQSIFPQLISFSVYQSSMINEDTRDILLFYVAGGSSMRDFSWNVCSRQTHHSRTFLNWLFRHSLNLTRYQFQTVFDGNGFELKYEDTLINAYVSHQFLIELKIKTFDMNTLHVLLHYLPQLEHLGNGTHLMICKDIKYFLN